MSPFAPILRRQVFKPSCPSGGTFYACQEERSSFVGCCTADACSNGCSNGNLKPASFDPSYYRKFQDQECPTGSQWYSCRDTNPTFMGCCKTDACANGCRQDDLTAAFLSSNPKVKADFVSSQKSESSSISPPASTTSASEASKTTAATAIMSSSQATKHPSTGAIIGSTIGGIAFLIIILALLAVRFRRQARKSRQQATFSRAAAQQSEKQTTEHYTKHASETAPLSSDVEGYELQLTPELMSTPAPSYKSLHSASELDGANPMQRAVAISSESVRDYPSPQVSQFSSDSPKLYQSWGNGR